MNVPHSSCSCSRCSSLTLNGRIQIIREFESHRSKKPSIKSLAAKFDCCYTEIKHILLNRENILFSYQNARKQKSKESTTTDDVTSRRQQKLGFLGKVMYEYLQRVLYSKYSIDDEKVLQKALEFKYYIGVEYFEPNKAWLEDFKRTYDIWGFDLGSLRQTITLKETKRPHLSAMDVVEYVRRQEREAAKHRTSSSTSHFDNSESKNDDRQKPANRIKEYEDTSRSNGSSSHEREMVQFYANSERDANHRSAENDVRLLEPMTEMRSNGNSLQQRQNPHYNGNELNDNSHCLLEPMVVYERIDDGDVATNYDEAPDNRNNSTMTQRTSDQNSESSCKRRHTSPMPSIESVEEALEHLKILEEYAMLQDNFRAIGLLTQLEQVFKKQTK